MAARWIAARKIVRRLTCPGLPMTGSSKSSRHDWNRHLHRRTTCALLAALTAFCGRVVHGADEPKGKLPVPDPISQARAETTIRETFKEEFEKDDPAGQLALAEKLLRLGIET